MIHLRLVPLLALSLAGSWRLGAVEDPSFTRHTVAATTAIWFARAAVDVDGDGLRDLVIHENCGYGGPLAWYRSSDAGRSWQRRLIADTGPGGTPFAAGDGAAGDIDGDGDIDVIACEHSGDWGRIGGAPSNHRPTAVHWYENRDRGARWIAHAVGQTPDFIKDLELADFDRDGQLDLVAIGYKDQNSISIFRQNADASWTKVVERAIDGLHEGMDVGDIDGDGDPDIATNGYWLQNPGGNLTGSWTLRSIATRWHDQTGSDWAINATKVCCHDIDGDGRDEVVISHSELSGYPIAWYDHPDPAGEGAWTERVIATGLSAVHTLQIGDLDGDGDHDLLVGENGDTGKDDDAVRTCAILVNEGDNRSWRRLVFPSAGLYNGILADFDADGDLDVMGTPGHENDPAYLWLNGTVRGPDAGWITLFNGRDLHGWHTEGSASWTVSGGVLTGRQDAATGDDNAFLVSDRRFSDCEVQLDVDPDWGFDTGVNLRHQAGRGYQCTLDHHQGAPAFGGLYGERFHDGSSGSRSANHAYWRQSWPYLFVDPTTLTANPDYRGAAPLYRSQEWSTIVQPGTWTTVRIRILGQPPQIQVWLDGRQVTDFTDELVRPFTVADGGIGLQVHGGARFAGKAARWRNIRVRVPSDGQPPATPLGLRATAVD